MEKPSKITVAGIRILVIGIACFGGYLFSQSAVFGKKLTGETLMVGAICSFAAGLGFHWYLVRQEKKRNKNAK